MIELIIAVAIGSFLTLTLIQLFANSKNAFEYQTGLAHARDNGRYALELIGRHVREAGHLGCNGNSRLRNDIVQLLPPGGGISSAEHPAIEPLLLKDHTNNPNSGNVAAGTDVLVTKAFRPLQLTILETSANSLKTRHKIGERINRGELLLISDCHSAEIFQATKLNKRKRLIYHNGLSKEYGPDAELARLDYNAFHIGYDKTTEQYNLYRRYIHTSERNGEFITTIKSEALLQGVDDLQVRYHNAGQADFNNASRIEIELQATHNNERLRFKRLILLRNRGSRI